MNGYGIKFANPADEKRFAIGSRWHSHDSGSTWIEGECNDPPKPVGASLTVEKVDRENGAVTMRLTPAP